jgi:TPR repeat protein
MVAVGRLLAAGLEGTPDLHAARPWFEQAAEAGDAYAQAWMGDCCRVGLVGAPDPGASEYWYRRAAGQNHIGAQIMLAETLTEFSPPSEEGLAEIFGLWWEAAAAGNSLAQRKTAECYLEGRGCPEDPVAAAEWFHAAAEQGDAEAAYQLGRCYKTGMGVRRNAATARFWLERASAQGHPDAGAVPVGR